MVKSNFKTRQKLCDFVYNNQGATWTSGARELQRKNWRHLFPQINIPSKTRLYPESSESSSDKSNPKSETDGTTGTFCCRSGCEAGGDVDLPASLLSESSSESEEESPSSLLDPEELLSSKLIVY
jgi:hypothetical protein